jgi:oxygen-independent coproporphyrinogen-3 oxidase
MAGLYLHIPFCRQACHYCNFHFSTSFRKKDELVAAMADELRLRRDELPGHTFETLYFGGGTPSALDGPDIERLAGEALSRYPFSPDPEVTLEANPEDITAQNLTAWRNAGINRLSIGVQGFQDDMLKNWNRAHDAQTALSSIKRAQDAGFDNISIDLIYGDPILDDDAWISNIRTVTDLGVPHISCYALTVEEKTALAYQVSQGRRPPVDDERSSRQYAMLQVMMRDTGYEQYEVSNFAKPGWHSRHNIAYWQDVPYIGIGPSAHSYDGVKRQWNIAHNIRYIDALGAGTMLTEFEILTPAQRYNEQVMTGLRTSMGIDLGKIRAIGSAFIAHLERHAGRYVVTGQIRVDGGRMVLDPSAYFLADGIAADLFMV